MNHWLLKSEPASYGIDDLAASPGRITAWYGVRNYQARNMLRDEVKRGDLAFFYHSGCEVPGIVGVVEIVKAGYVDPTQFDLKDDHHDPESTRDAPRWYCVDVKLKRKLKRTISLEELRAQKPLSSLRLLQRGNRLSVMPVAKAEWERITDLERRRPFTR